MSELYAHVRRDASRAHRRHRLRRARVVAPLGRAHASTNALKTPSSHAPRPPRREAPPPPSRVYQPSPPRLSDPSTRTRPPEGCFARRDERLGSPSRGPRRERTRPGARNTCGHPREGTRRSEARGPREAGGRRRTRRKSLCARRGARGRARRARRAGRRRRLGRGRPDPPPSRDGGASGRSRAAGRRAASAAARASTMVSTQVSRWPRESAASNARDMARAASSSGREVRAFGTRIPGRGRATSRDRGRGVRRRRGRASRARSRSRPYFAARTRISVSSPRRPRGEADRKPRERRRGSPRVASRSAPRAVGGRVSSSSTPEERRGPSPRSRARRVAWGRRARRATRRRRVARRARRDAAAPRAARGRHVGEPTTTTARPSIPPDGVARRFPAKTLAPEPLARLQPRRRAPLAASATPDGDATAEAPTLAVIVREKSVWMRLSEPPFYPFSWFRDVASKSSFSFQILSMSVGQRKRDESKESSSRGRPLASRPAFLECRTVRGGTTSRNGQLLSAFSEQPRRAEGTSPRASHTHER